MGGLSGDILITSPKLKLLFHYSFPSFKIVVLCNTFACFPLIHIMKMFLIFCKQDISVEILEICIWTIFNKAFLLTNMDFKRQYFQTYHQKEVNLFEKGKHKRMENLISKKYLNLYVFWPPLVVIGNSKETPQCFLKH